MSYINRILSILQVLMVGAHCTMAYDYIIVGGGTAGLTIAARLTEDSKISVLVLEAGNNHTDDLNVLAPGLFPIMYGNPEYDWNYKTVPQQNVNSRVFAHPRGKQLGGSSAINFMFWTHASQQDINNWGELGNKGWSWDALQPFFKKSESYIAPSKKIEEDLQVRHVDENVHGYKGPIKNTYPDSYGPLLKAWPRTFENLGIAVNSDPRGGLALGGYINLLNIDTKTHTRSYAGNAYYLPVKSRPNLKVLTGTLVEKVLIKKGKNGVSATGVQYSTASEGSVKVEAKQEVILSAGTIASPQLLELSGIGNSELLRNHDIEVLVKNDHVGENLQDHIYLPIGYEVIPGVPTLEDFADPAYFQAALDQYLANATGPLSSAGASSGVLSLSQIGHKNLKVPNDIGKAVPAWLAAQYKVQAKHFRTEAVAQELTIGGGISPQFSDDSTKLFSTTSPGNFLTLLGVLQHPFSRGSIHINSSSPKTYPTIDPGYLSHPFDLAVLSRIVLHVDHVISKSQPLSGYLKGSGTVYQPGYAALTEENVESWIKKHLQSEFHPIGTCAMLPEAKGGVVDERFRVYGVQGLRVIDASVFPLMVRANIQSLVYAVAERGAQFVKDDVRQ